MIYKLLQTVEVVFQKFYNFVLRRRFNRSSKLYIHRSARIFGAENISIGANFTALVGLRLEAVVRYHSLDYAPKIVIKDNVTFTDYVHIGATNYVEVGNNVLVASKVFISDHSHGFYSGVDQSSPETPPSKRDLTRDKSVIIEDNVWICESVSILPGVRIGFGSIIGAHAVVTGDIPPFTIAVGAPARVVKKYNMATRQWDAADA